MNIIGKTTINPFLFYTGKISGYFTWIALLMSFLGFHFLQENSFMYNRYFAIGFLIAGLAITTLSMINLGDATRLGLPSESTTFKTNGTYKLSRNPMYVGFNFITISSIIYFSNIIIFILGSYSIIVYHLIILGEEKFLSNRFGKEYTDYIQKVRRYI